MKVNSWHISDPHLSFNAQGEVLKPMDQRTWSNGTSAYVGYLDKIKEFAAKNIRPHDFTYITGDITHNFGAQGAVFCLKWLAENIPGIKVICRGNHDKKWEVSKIRRKWSVPLDTYLIDEGEIISIGPYTIGCWSNHNTKTSDMNGIPDEQTRLDYVGFASDLAAQAARKERTPIYLSHYPVLPNTAERIGEMGIKAYLSGHVHCTTNKNEGEDINGVYWGNYDKSAGLTDDKVFKGCFFSTGTTDVLLAKHKSIFKKIDCLSYKADKQSLREI